MTVLNTVPPKLGWEREVTVSEPVFNGSTEILENLNITRVLFLYIFVPFKIHKSWNPDSNFMFLIKIILFCYCRNLHFLFTKLKFCQYLPFSPASDFFLEWLQKGILATGMYAVFNIEKQRASQAWGNSLSSSVLQTVFFLLFLSLSLSLAILFLHLISSCSFPWPYQIFIE